MKKPIVLIAAIVAVVGLGAVAAVAKETIKVKTSVSMKFTGTHPSESGTFVGKVKARKGCRKQRRVVSYWQGRENRYKAGADRSNNRGRYRIDPKNVPDHSVRALVEAEKKIIENDGEKIVCKKARSKKVPFRP